MSNEPAVVGEGWSQPRPGATEDQNEDAFVLRTQHQSGHLTVALADGASGTVYARTWARTLVSAAEADWPCLPDEELTARLDALRERFDPIGDTDPPWYVAHKFARYGSQAALLVLALVPSPDGTADIRGLAVGDCLAAILKAGRPAVTFPLSQSTEFGRHPMLVASKPQSRVVYQRWRAHMEAGDVLVACTDGVGRWLLQQAEAGQEAAILRLLLRVDDLARPDQRQRGRPLAAAPDLDAPETLSQDDLTLVICGVAANGTAAAEAIRAMLSDQLGLPPRGAAKAPDGWRSRFWRWLRGLRRDG